MSGAGAGQRSEQADSACQEKLERLLLQATSPANTSQDVNTIKQFCDCVTAWPEGPLQASRLLAHKINSPLDKEALQALAVLEACVKSCGQKFQLEVGKFRFLNEMIKLISPNHAGSRTPAHVKQKVVELLYVWTKEIPHEKKIIDAYQLLKAQGLVEADPDYVSTAVFAPSLPPRQADLDTAEQRRLQELLRSTAPADIQQANKLIQSMVRRDEARMEVAVRQRELVERAGAAARLLQEMLDSEARQAASGEERDLMAELQRELQELRPGLYRLAGQLGEDESETLGQVLDTTEEVGRAVERYRTSTSTAPVRGGQDVTPASLDLVCLTLTSSPARSPLPDLSTADLASSLVRQDLLTDTQGAFSDLLANSDLLADGDLKDSSSHLPGCTAPTPASCPAPVVGRTGGGGTALDTLDLLGESLVKQSLPGNVEASFDLKRGEKLPLNQIKKKDSEEKIFEVKDLTSQLAASPAELPAPLDIITELSTRSSPSQADSIIDPGTVLSGGSAEPEVALGTLKVDPALLTLDRDLPPLVLQEAEAGVSVVLHCTQQRPGPGVAVLVAAITNHQAAEIRSVEWRPVVSRECRVRLLVPTGTSLPSISPFAPPAALSQAVLLHNPGRGPVQLGYCLTYRLGEDSRSEVGAGFNLPDSLWTP